MHPDRPDELAAAAGGYLSYSGPYTVVGDNLIARHIAISLLPNWIGGTQYRAARLHGPLLELSPPQQDPHQWRTPQRQTRLAPRVIRGDGPLPKSEAGKGLAVSSLISRIEQLTFRSQR